jgi:hypothetical protein
LKTTTKILLGAGVVLVIAYFWRPAETLPSAINQTTATQVPRPEHFSEPKIRGRAPKPNAPEGASRPVHSETHGLAEFKKGELQNTLVGDGLQMGTDATYAPRLRPFKIFGIYTSPEQRPGESFDTVTPSYDGWRPEGSELTFEFRTRPEAEEWSTWREVSVLDLPLKCQPANAWQYRLTFYANDPSNSPKVHTVTMATLKSDTMFTAQTETSESALRQSHNQQTQNPQEP